jgi:hypothetical protein
VKLERNARLFVREFLIAQFGVQFSSDRDRSLTRATCSQDSQGSCVERGTSSNVLCVVKTNRRVLFVFYDFLINRDVNPISDVFMPSLTLTRTLSLSYAHRRTRPLRCQKFNNPQHRQYSCLSARLARRQIQFIIAF